MTEGSPQYREPTMSTAATSKYKDVPSSLPATHASFASGTSRQGRVLVHFIYLPHPTLTYHLLSISLIVFNWPWCPIYHIEQPFFTFRFLLHSQSCTFQIEGNSYHHGSPFSKKKNPRSLHTVPPTSGEVVVVAFLLHVFCPDIGENR